MTYYISKEKLDAQMLVAAQNEKRVQISLNRCGCCEDNWGFIIEGEDDVNVIVCDECYHNSPNKYC
jgi:hypothetical protein